MKLSDCAFSSYLPICSSSCCPYTTPGSSCSSCGRKTVDARNAQVRQHLWGEKELIFQTYCLSSVLRDLLYISSIFRFKFKLPVAATFCCDSSWESKRRKANCWLVKWWQMVEKVRDFHLKHFQQTVSLKRLFKQGFLVMREISSFITLH